MVHIYYTRIREKMPDHLFRAYLHTLPAAQQQRNRGFVRWQDRHANLLGRLLLRQALAPYGYGSEALALLQYNAYNRPFIAGGPDFNLSHSADLVVCAIGAGYRLGIDVEKIRPIDFGTVATVMSEAQWAQIAASPDPQRTFFRFWAMKESIAKADNRGLNLPFSALVLRHGQGICDHRLWHLQPIALDRDAPCYLATDRPVTHTAISYRDFYRQDVPVQVA